MTLHFPSALRHPTRLLRPRRRGIASVNAEMRDGIIPAADRVAQTDDHAGGAPGTANYRTIALIVACAFFMEALDATVLATALPTMARDFGFPAPAMSAALTSYLLALAIFIPASGFAADRFGARPVFGAAIALFMAGSIGCALAPSLEAMVATRFLQGIGGAMMVPVGRLVLLRSVAKKDMVAAMSWLIMPALVGPILGPPVGGFIVTYLSWRWIFWLNLPISLVGIGLVIRFIPDVREPVAHRFDLAGFMMSGLALGGLLTGFELGSREGHGRPALAAIAAGIIFGALYVRHARRHAHPILDLTLMRVETFRISVIAGSLSRITQGSLPYLLPLMLQLGFGLSPAQSGLTTIAPAIGSFGMKPFGRRLLRRYGFRNSLMGIGGMGVLAYAACGLFRPGWPIAAIFVVLLGAGFLMSFQFTGYNTIAYDEIAKERMSAATSFYSTFQQLTLSLGICTAALALHAAMLIGHRATPSFADFTAAFWTVTAISICAVFVNAQFDPHAGDELAGRSPS